MKRLLSTLGLCAVAAFAASAAAPAAKAEQFVTVLTGGASGVYYPLGTAVAGLVAKAAPEVKTSVQATKASVENLNLLQAGRGEIAFTLGDSLSFAWKGDADAGFKAPLTKLRTIGAIYPNHIQIVASKDSGVKTLADLKGKRVSVGAPKSGTELNARAIFGAAGFGYDALAKVEYLPFAESVDLMKNRQLDATLISAGLGVAAVRDLAASIEITIVSVPAEVIAKIGDPTYVSEPIPAGTYRGQDADVPTAAVRNFLVSHDGVSDDLAYAMTKAVYENLDAMVAAHAAAKLIRGDASAAKSPAPLHPGAARYFKEKGWM